MMKFSSKFEISWLYLFLVQKKDCENKLFFNGESKFCAKFIAQGWVLSDVYFPKKLLIYFEENDFVF